MDLLKTLLITEAPPFLCFWDPRLRKMVKSYQAEAGYLLRGITLTQGPLQDLQKLLASWGEHSVQATRPQDVIISLKLLSLLARVMHTLQCTHNAASDIVGFVIKQTLKLSFSKVGRVHCTVTLHSGFTVINSTRH